MKDAPVLARMYEMMKLHPERIWWVQYDDEGTPRIMNKLKSERQVMAGADR